MMELYLELAGIRVRIQSEEKLFDDPGILTEFCVEPGPWIHSYHVGLAHELPVPQGRECYADPVLRVYDAGDAVIRYGGDLSSGTPRALYRLERRGNRCELLFRRSALYDGITTPKLLLGAIEAEHLLTVNRGFLLHASYIEYSGRAILFTAPSETGKSTQAQLWCDHVGAELINGDRAAVRILDDGVKACGIPFSGSSPVRKNVTAPLAAIVYLSQAPDNTLSRLRGVSAFRRVWEGCTVNTWAREDVSLTTQTVTDVIGSVPVYHLACTPDVRAVELLKRTMEVHI